MLAWLFLLICLVAASVVVYLYQERSRKEWEWELIYLTRHSKNGAMPPIKPMKKISLAPVFGGIKRLGQPTRRINENDFFAPVHDDLSDLPIFSSAPKPKDTQLHAATRLKETFEEERQAAVHQSAHQAKPIEKIEKVEKTETIISVKPLQNLDDDDEMEMAETISANDLHRYRAAPLEIEIEEEDEIVEEQEEPQPIVFQDKKDDKPTMDLSNPDPESEVISAEDISRQIPVKPAKPIIDDYPEKEIISAEEIIRRIGATVATTPKTQQSTRTIAAGTLKKTNKNNTQPEKRTIGGDEVRRNLTQRNTADDANQEIITADNLGTPQGELSFNMKYADFPKTHKNRTETVKPVMRSVIPPEARWVEVAQPENKVPDKPISTVFTPFANAPKQRSNPLKKTALISQHETPEPSFDYDDNQEWSLKAMDDIWENELAVEEPQDFIQENHFRQPETAFTTHPNAFRQPENKPQVVAYKDLHSPSVTQRLFSSARKFQLPNLSLLIPPQLDFTVGQSEEEILQSSITIEEKLAEFRVKVRVMDAFAGPVITRYEIEPDTGVRGSQVVNLEKDLARALGHASIRVVETIPGKTCMGLELPNPQRKIIRLSEIFGTETFASSKSKLTLALGQDITGKPVVTDLAKAPHLLVAGTTGSGKSVGVNSMILSMLFKARPDEVRMIMIDPKMLELSIYEGIPHLLAPVITDMKLAPNALNWCVNEMEKRYRLMSHLGVRNVAGYNQKIAEAEKLNKRLANPFSLTPSDPEPLEKFPFIVVVVDEFADLMMVGDKKKVEECIVRLAQKARAAGIHLILATQRPSVDVITGLIKANIPTRIAFQVASTTDSRTVLDQKGAENLLGQGDMLFLPPGSPYPQRIHGAFVADDEVHRIVEYLKQFGEPQYIDDILTAGVAGGDLFSNEVGGMNDGETDELYDASVKFVIETNKTSISALQRHLRIGYNRAANIIEAMENAGVISSADSSGKRKVLINPE